MAGGSGRESGDLGSAFLEYLHPRGNAQMKLGRFFLTEGAAVETSTAAPLWRLLRAVG